MAFKTKSRQAGIGAQSLDVNKLKAQGRYGDVLIGHLNPEDIIIPKEAQTPGLVAQFARNMRRSGDNPSSHVAGSSMTRKNPRTGLPEFAHITGTDSHLGENLTPEEFQLLSEQQQSGDYFFEDIIGFPGYSRYGFGPEAQARRGQLTTLEGADTIGIDPSIGADTNLNEFDNDDVFFDTEDNVGAEGLTAFSEMTPEELQDFMDFIDQQQDKGFFSFGPEDVVPTIAAVMGVGMPGMMSGLTSLAGADLESFLDSIDFDAALDAFTDPDTGHLDVAAVAEALGMTTAEVQEAIELDPDKEFTFAEKAALITSMKAKGVGSFGPSHAENVATALESAGLGQFAVGLDVEGIDQVTIDIATAIAENAGFSFNTDGSVSFNDTGVDFGDLGLGEVTEFDDASIGEDFGVGNDFGDLGLGEVSEFDDASIGEDATDAAAAASTEAQDEQDQAEDVAAAAAESEDTEEGSPSSDPDDDPSDTDEDDSDKILCAVLHTQGYLPNAIYAADERYGAWLRENKPKILAGYHAWAKPATRWLQTDSKLAKWLALFLVPPWAEEMAHREDPTRKSNWFGKLVFAIGIPSCLVCYWIQRLRGKV